MNDNSDLEESKASLISPTLGLTEDEDSPSREDQQQQEKVIDEMGMYGFFRSYYDNASGEEETSSILSKPINEEESKFLLRLMDKQSQGFITYEE